MERVDEIKLSRSPRRAWIVGFLMAPLIGIGAYGLGSSHRTGAPAAQPQDRVSISTNELSVAEADLDLGEVWEQKQFSWRLPISNQSDKPLEIVRFSTSCACTSVEPSSLTIPAKQTATITLKVDLTHRTLSEAGVARRALGVSIQPQVLNDARRGESWRLRGVVKSRVTLDTLGIHFGEQPVRGGLPTTRKILATVHVPCSQLDVKVDPKVAFVSVERSKSQTAQFEITIAPNSDLPAESFKAEAVIVLTGPNREELFGCVLPIDGKMQPEVRLLPTTVFLGPVAVGATAEAVVTLQVPAESKTAVDHIESDSPCLSVEPAAIEGATPGHTFRIRQKSVCRR